MIKSIIEIVSNAVIYILNIRLHEIPRILAYIGISAGIGYCAALILIGFPCSIWEAITKTIINDDKQGKVIFRISVLLTIIILTYLFHQMSMK